MISVTSQVIQTVLSFVPVEWQLPEHCRYGKNDAQTRMQNLPAEMQRDGSELGDVCCPMLIPSRICWGK